MKTIRIISCIFAALFIFSFVAGSACAVVQPILFFDPDVVESNTGDDDQLILMLDGTVRGLSGYGLVISIEDPDIAEITGLVLPEWAGLKNVRQINSTSYLVQGTDIRNQQEPGICKPIPLVDIRIHARYPGYATIVATPVVIDDDQRGRYDPQAATGSIVITGAGPVPVIPMSR
jgi:hypothetical protein